MLNRWGRLDRNTAMWRVAVALMLSLLLHFIVLGFIHIDLSVFKPEQDFVEVRFAHLVKPPPPIAEIPKEAKPAPAPLEAPLPEIKPPEPVPEAQSSAMVLPDASPQPELESEELPQKLSELEAPEPVEEIKPEPVMTDITSEGNPLDPDVRPFDDVETDFDILRGIDGYKVGQTKIRYQARDGGYLLISESEAKGFASLFLSGKLIQRSEGRVTERGLQPQEFLYQYGKSGKKQRALFDWDTRRLTLETDKGAQKGRLPKDTQDLMSFMYQFMFVPPLQEMQLNITNGKRLKAYGYSFVGEVDLSTKLGVVRAMHLENINDDGDEKNEIWLAVDYRFLPVKIRKTEKDGSVIEQVMTNINTDIEQ